MGAAELLRAREGVGEELGAVLADADGEAGALGEPSVDAAVDGVADSEACADCPAEAGEAEPTVWVDDAPQAAHRPAATTAAVTSGSRAFRNAAERG
ncbi:hypothetical protein GCM10010343_37940 [Streptomyces avidinii]|nr:hypothetical protein GCM10010343_37940 [Streptomyces avidinii]